MIAPVFGTDMNFHVALECALLFTDDHGRIEKIRTGFDVPASRMGNLERFAIHRYQVQGTVRCVMPDALKVTFGEREVFIANRLTHNQATTGGNVRPVEAGIWELIFERNHDSTLPALDGTPERGIIALPLE